MQAMKDETLAQLTKSLRVEMEKFDKNSSPSARNKILHLGKNIDTYLTANYPDKPKNAQLL